MLTKRDKHYETRDHWLSEANDFGKVCIANESNINTSFFLLLWCAILCFYWFYLPVSLVFLLCSFFFPVTPCLSLSTPDILFKTFCYGGEMKRPI